MTQTKTRSATWPEPRIEPRSEIRRESRHETGTEPQDEPCALAQPPLQRLRARLHPESGAGGFSAIDGTVIFYVRVAALLTPGATVLDLGAGRGRAHLDDPVSFRRSLMDLRGRCARVIGVDPDPAVLDNPSLDEAMVMPSPEEVPLRDASVDLILADHVLEHVADPQAFARECGRLLRPGGWLCARTPNRWGLVAMASRAIPEGVHGAVLARAQPHRRHEDVFPTCYRLNTRGALARAFPAPGWGHHVHGWNSEPAYAGRSAIAWRAMQALQAILPPAMDANLHVFLRRGPPRA
ncbi:class I SAM-dependent methyltransferase [uncultured Albimonas sp.]|uniref:class I SAM-dependent methyltransferase n=1 Tax=uncultured Albimonas sp. TaxID=1331701 RepID=UPI0030EDA0B2|tara:strand:- start:2998 stop:3882 length:885 start_codon:yes stop_codon:yes gene_type:complete